jgi:hypothetical protein
VGIKDNKYSHLLLKFLAKFFLINALDIKFKGVNVTKVHGVSFGRNRRRTCEKTQASKEKTAKEDL